MGLCLLPGEEKLFEAFPGAVMPYIALQKPGRKRKRIQTHQLVQEPCPLYDAATKTCTVYENRPMICKAYPFSHVPGDGGAYSIETTCTWVKAERDTIDYGTTPGRAGTDQDVGAIGVASFFTSLRDRMRKTGYTQLLVLDLETRNWRVVCEAP